MNDVTLYRGRPIGSESLTEQQRSAVGYFFVRLKAIDPIEYDRMMPDEKTERMIKREYASSLITLTKEQMDNGFAAWHEKRRDCDPEFRFINIDKIIGLMYENRTSAAHKVFTPCLPESEEAKAERKAKGRERMATIKSLFDE